MSCVRNRTGTHKRPVLVFVSVFVVLFVFLEITDRADLEFEDRGGAEI